MCSCFLLPERVTEVHRYCQEQCFCMQSESTVQHVLPADQVVYGQVFRNRKQGRTACDLSVIRHVCLVRDHM